MKFSFLFLMSIFILFSCNDNSTGIQKPKVVELMPLKVGNYWIYKSYEKDRCCNQDINFIDTLKVRNSLIFLGGDTVYNDYVFELSARSNNLQPFFYSINLNDGFHGIGYPGLDIRFFKYPGYKDYIYMSNEWIYILEDTSVELTTIAGKFTCYKYIVTNEEFKQIYFISPNVGLIYLELWRKSSITGLYTLKRSNELIDYKLK